jgi:hypothetical protein
VSSELAYSCFHFDCVELTDSDAVSWRQDEGKWQRTE